MLHVLEVDKDTLCCLRTEINSILCVFRHALECLEHQVELTDISEIVLSAGRARDLMFFNKGSHLLLGPSVHRAFQLDPFFFAVVFDQFICTETLMALLAVHQRVAESSQMSGSHPCLRVHQDRAVNAYIVRILLHELFPPRSFYIVLQLHAKVSVIPGVRKSPVDLGTGIYKSP